MLEVRPLAEDERDWALEVQTASWGEPVVARRGELVDTRELSALAAVEDGRPIGLATYAVRGEECELVTLRSLVEGRGAGRALLEAVRDLAAAAGCRRLWLVTTNDSTRALALYQRFGFDLCAFRPHAVTQARRALKPTIPERGADGIPIRHELELELEL
ncbi:MAG TPA: GNAT family N-acetyltransferase [Gaiellaceae bacterium]|nr:GNAT family N-acetyltransferase [Gaiellaceae bacterium]